ncbi:MAG: TorF family putative porin [Pseudomonadota bacterium]
MKINKIALACGVAMLGVSVHSMAEVSMNIGATSNYIWRGVTQTEDAAAISGGVDWASDIGLYAGAWASNVQFAPDTTPYELDLYGGYSAEVGDFGYDAGLIYYTYDGDADANFLELALSGSWKFLNAGFNYTLSADNDDAEGDLYYFAGLSFDLPQDFAIGGTIGSYDYDAGGDYTHFQIDLTKSAGDFGDVSLSLTDTDLDNDDPIFFVSWGKSF